MERGSAGHPCNPPDLPAIRHICQRHVHRTSTSFSDPRPPPPPPTPCQRLVTCPPTWCWCPAGGRAAAMTYVAHWPRRSGPLPLPVYSWGPNEVNTRRRRACAAVRVGGAVSGVIRGAQQGNLNRKATEHEKWQRYAKMGALASGSS